MFIQPPPGFGKVNLSDFKTGSTSTHSEGTLKAATPKQQIPCIYKHTVACCEALGLLAFNFSISDHLIRDSFFLGPVCFFDEDFHALVFEFCSFSKLNHFTLPSIP